MDGNVFSSLPRDRFNTDIDEFGIETTKLYIRRLIRLSMIKKTLLMIFVISFYWILFEDNYFYISKRGVNLRNKIGMKTKYFLNVDNGLYEEMTDEYDYIDEILDGNQVDKNGNSDNDRKSRIIPENSELRNQIGVEAATIVMLCRNSDLDDAIHSIKSLESTFNNKFKYPWVFLNDEDFDEKFKYEILKHVSGRAQFGTIPYEHWSVPDSINATRAMKAMELLGKERIPYGNSASYRHMCRYNSGFFFKHPLMEPYRYYWRVEPNVDFFCNLNYDPFTFLRTKELIYGFTITLPDYEKTIPTLWSSTLEFLALNPKYISADNGLPFLLDHFNTSLASHIKIPSNNNTFSSFDINDYDEESIKTKRLLIQELKSGHYKYNTCHFWTNFEIADLSFWRSEVYQEYFKFLDSKGGFYYERWGDAPVHSLALLLFLPKNKIWHFADVGYNHNPFRRCPVDAQSYISGRCQCARYIENFDNSPASCLPRWWDLVGKNIGASGTEDWES